MRTLLLVSLAVALVGCPKKTAAPEPAPEPGWHQVGTLQCFRPYDYASEPNSMRRKDLRQATWDALARGLRGEIEGAPAMEGDQLESLELMLLGHPDRIEMFAIQAYQRCNAAADSGVTGYVAWLEGAAKSLSEGDCNRPLVFEVHDELKVSTGWQQRYHMCSGDRIRIEIAGGETLYSVYDTGSQETTTFHGILGDPSNPPTPDAPCSECRAGEVLMRFEEDDGGTAIGPFVQGEAPEPALVDPGDVLRFTLEFVAPAHGFISFGFNDTTYYDNVLYVHPEGYTEYIPIDLYPVIGEGDMYLGN